MHCYYPVKDSQTSEIVSFMLCDLCLCCMCFVLEPEQCSVLVFVQGGAPVVQYIHTFLLSLCPSILYTIYIFCHSSLCPCRAGLLSFVLCQCRATSVVFYWVRAGFSSCSLSFVSAGQLLSSFVVSVKRSASVVCPLSVQGNFCCLLLCLWRSQLSRCLSFVGAGQLLSSFLMPVQS
jgi:hypothetical protein